jgi:rSAM/selenodomain-associated transferase 1
VADLSKPLGLGGLRIGWVATRDRGALAAISRWVQLLSGGPSVLAVNSALDAMRRFGELRESHLARARKNTPALLRLLKRAGWHVELAAAGATLLARPPVPLSPEQLERLRENGLFLLPSDVFGVSGGVRVSRYADPGLLDRALCLLGDTQARSLVILAKAPLPGYAKTRLAAAIGLEGTRLLAQAFLQDTLSVAAAVPTSQIIAFTPRKSRAFFASSAPGARLIPQPDGDLGERISSALNAALEESSAAVLIGTDTPDLLPSIIDRAFRALEWSDLVLGPAEDGGFYLIGVRGRLPRALFDRVEWSTSAVFARVAANAECLGLSAEALDPWLDVDDLPSLQALELRLAKHSRAPRTRAALARLTAELPDGA